MNAVLTKLYHNPEIALTYDTEWELLVAVQLSAQCTDERVNQVTPKLFATYRTVGEYARAKQSDMEDLVFRTGFYRNKAKNIIAAAQKLEQDFGGVLPQTMAELLTLPGVARKTANVVLSTLWHKSEGIEVDTHVRTFALRFDLSD